MAPVGPRLAMFITSITYTLMCLGAAMTTSDPGTTGTSPMQHLVCSHPYLRCQALFGLSISPPAFAALERAYSGPLKALTCHRRVVVELAPSRLDSL